MIGLPLAYHALGRAPSPMRRSARSSQKFAGEWAYQIAEVHAFRGEIDEAFAWLDRAYAQRDGGFSEMKGDPLLKNLEGDPRYAGVPAETEAAGLRRASAGHVSLPRCAAPLSELTRGRSRGVEGVAPHSARSATTGSSLAARRAGA